MRLANVKRGDIVEASVRGHVFRARIRNLRCGEIPGKPILIEPLSSNISFYHLSAHQVKRVLA